MLLGLLTTIFLIPNTTGADNKPSTLEILAAEDSHVNNLMKRMWKGKKDESLLHRNGEAPSEEDHRSSDIPTDVEKGMWTAHNRLGVDRSENVELNRPDKFSIGEPALVGSPS